MEKTAHPPQTLPVRAQARCSTLPALMEQLAAPKAVVLSPSPHPTSSPCGFGELDQCKRPGAAGRVGAELSHFSNLWQTGDYGEFCTKMPIHQQDSGLQAWVGIAHIPMGAASTIPPPAKRSIKPLISHWISTLLPSLSLGLQRQEPSLTHTAPRLALNYLKAQQVF